MTFPLKAVVFDMDGCLIDSESVYVSAWQETFRANAIPISLPEILSWQGTGWLTIRGAINQVTQDDALTLRLRAEREAYFFKKLDRHEVCLEPYAEDLLAYLRDRGIKLGLATMTFRMKALRIIEHFGLEAIMDAMVFGDEVEHSKPAPDIYLRALADLRVSAAETLAFEDSKSGLQAAIQAGLRVVHVPDVSGQIDDVPGIYQTIDTFAQAVPIIEKLR